MKYNEWSLDQAESKITLLIKKEMFIAGKSGYPST